MQKGNKSGQTKRRRQEAWLMLTSTNAVMWRLDWNQPSSCDFFFFFFFFLTVRSQNPDAVLLLNTEKKPIKRFSRFLLLLGYEAGG